jgi:hypothetical protein
MRYSFPPHLKHHLLVAALGVVSVELVAFATHGADYQLTTNFTARRAPAHGPAIASPACVGDCDSQGTVTVGEILTMVNIALGNADISACQPGDANGDDRVTVDEILRAVSNALNSCAPAPTATSTPPKQSTPTPGSGFSCWCDCTCRWCTAHTDCTSPAGSCPGCSEICYEDCTNSYYYDCGSVLFASGTCGP